MNYIPNYTGFKAINEKTNFILGPTPGGDPHKEYGKPFFIEVDSKNKRSVDKKIKSISLGKGAGPTNKNLRVYWTKGKFGDVARIEASTPGALQDLLDVLDNKKDGIQSMGWVDLEESVTEGYADDAFETDWVQMQNNAKGLGGRPKGNKGIEIKSKDLKGAFKITLKKGPGNYTDSEVEIIWPDGHKDKSTSLSKANDILRKIGNPKIGLDWEEMKESLDEAAPKMNVDPNAEYVTGVIVRLWGMERNVTGPNVKKDIKKAIKALQNLRSSIQVGR